MSRRRWVPAAAVATVLALAGAGCGGDDSSESSGGQSDEGRPAQKFEAGTTMARIADKGEIRIGVKYDVPPFGFKNPRNNAIEGFDIDFGKAVAQKLGVKPTFVEAISDNRIPFITDGTVDLVLSTMTINEERAQEIGFTDPYFIARGRILTEKGSDIKGVSGPRGQEGLHRARLDVRGDAEEAGAQGGPAARRHLLGVPGADPERRRRRGVDRRRDPHRHDHPGRQPGARSG